MSDVANTRNPFKFDGTIPAWGIVLLGVSWATYSWTSMRELETRVIRAESTIDAQRKKTDKLEVQQEAATKLMSTISIDLGVLKELMVRVEKRLGQ